MEEKEQSKLIPRLGQVWSQRQFSQYFTFIKISFQSLTTYLVVAQTLDEKFVVEEATLLFKCATLCKYHFNRGIHEKIDHVHIRWCFFFSLFSVTSLTRNQNYGIRVTTLSVQNFEIYFFLSLFEMDFDLYFQNQYNIL